MSHPDEGTWNALLDGEIPSGELAPITAHLATCAACRARLEEARALMGEADQLVSALGDPAMPPPAAIVPPTTTRIGVYRQLAWAASVVLAATLGYSVRQPGQPAGAMADSSSPRLQESPESPPSQAGASPDSTARLPIGVLGNRPPPATAPASPPLSAAAEPGAMVRHQAPPAHLAESPVTVTPPAAQVLGSAQRLNDSRARGLAQDSRTLGAAAPSLPLAERADAIVESFRPIEFSSAVTLLGGGLRLVDGLVPDRLEASGSTVRVIYPLLAGELVLEQRRVGDSIRVSLRGPVSADSLAVLLGRVR